MNQAEGAKLLDKAEALERLADIVPFRYLGAGELASLGADAELHSYAAKETLIVQGDEAGDEVFVLIAGSVESLDASRDPPFRMNVVEAGSYFGEQSCLIGAPRPFEVAALEPSQCLVVPGARFLRLLAESRSFAQAFGVKLREGLGIFDAFDRFTAEVLRGAALGHIEVRRLTELYKALAPALHPLAGDESRVDWGALSYAVRRLPENLTRSFVFLLTDNLPTVYASPALLFPFVATEARHRFVYEMMPGKDMVLIRNGMSDLMDFITCLCLFAVEAKKIRYRLNHPDYILALSRFLTTADWIEEPAELSTPLVGGYDEGEDDEGLLERLPFAPEEREELRRLWPRGAASRVREIVFHRQAYSVDVRKQVNNFNGRLSELWAGQVGEAAERLLGVRPADFPADFEVHLVSSNTHSVSNCLNPFFAAAKDEILGWAERQGLRNPGWVEPFDEVYHLSRPWFEAFPSRRAEFDEAERAAGIVRLPETVTTGIQVQLVDPASIRARPIDAGVAVGARGAAGPRSLLVNIDYAFGEQAEEIMRSLLLLFGRNVRTISVLGKAGALQGGRGDILLPSAFIEQANDAFQPLPDAAAGSGAGRRGRLERALPGRAVHSGPLLTVGGTLLQNRAMLEFYRRIWGCVGLEMEGIWYLRAVLEAEELGVLRRGAERNFLYYVSDLPLAAGQRLSERLSPLEGVPPLYAITRELLSGIFGPARGRA